MDAILSLPNKKHRDKSPKKQKKAKPARDETNGRAGRKQSADEQADNRPNGMGTNVSFSPSPNRNQSNDDSGILKRRGKTIPKPLAENGGRKSHSYTNILKITKKPVKNNQAKDDVQHQRPVSKLEPLVPKKTTATEPNGSDGPNNKQSEGEKDNEKKKDKGAKSKDKHTNNNNNNAGKEKKNKPPTPSSPRTKRRPSDEKQRDKPADASASPKTKKRRKQDNNNAKGKEKPKGEGGTSGSSDSEERLKIKTEIDRTKKREVEKKVKQTDSNVSANDVDKKVITRQRSREEEEEEEDQIKCQLERDMGSCDYNTEEEEEEDSASELPSTFNVTDSLKRRLHTEFDELQEKSEKKPKPDHNCALEYHNISKNRYGNVLPNPHTRVRLAGRKSQDYINANYVKGEGGTMYIACQAPLPSTFDDFWRMIWEQKVYVIVMLTKLEEGRRIKAQRYWPTTGPLGRTRVFTINRGGNDENQSGGNGHHGLRLQEENDDSGGFTNYGQISVRLERTERKNKKLTIRYFRIFHNNDQRDKREVVHIHFEGWPDFGRPKSTALFKQLLYLMEKYRAKAPSESDGPLVLHCSAGLGRTGTLIAAHIALEQIRLGKVESSEEVNMKKIVEELREQRSGMVQTKDQYLFLHQLVREYSKKSPYI